MTETGTVRVDYHQFLLTGAAADTTDIVEEGTLLWTGPGFVAVLTGIPNGVVTVTVDTASARTDLAQWEVAEETVVDAPGGLLVVGLDGEVASGFTPIPAGRYQVRAYARGRDAEWDFDATVSGERYLLEVSPTRDPVAGIRELRKTDTAHARISPEKHVPEIDNEHVYVSGPGGGVVKVGKDSPEARAVYAQRDLWGGRPPSSERLATDLGFRVSASCVADLDRDLVDEIDALPADRQRALARWCARRAFERAGLTEFADFRAALDAMDNDTAPPPDFANPSLLRHRIETDPTIPLTVVPGFAGYTERMPQSDATSVYMYAVAEPSEADYTSLAGFVFGAVRIAAHTYGPDYVELFARIRNEFLGDPV